ncbi:MAG: hypothetical protein H6711_29140 [Myxococcales bacterium]|nr:hypothetical protein [Myxococcales bacterium]
MKDPADAIVRSTVTDHLHVHPRLVQQGLVPDADARRLLLAGLPSLVPFSGNRYFAARAILDWDHQLPSQNVILRLYLSYSDRDAHLLESELARRERVIATDNLYPEFDLPDYGMLPASETYVAMMRADRLMIEDLRFSSEWRRRVDQSAQRAALTSVRRLDSFTRSLQERTHEHLGPPVVIGWTPPCLAHSTNWAIEVWLLVDFDGHRGRAHVFMVDSGTHEVTRELFTEVLLG